MTCPLPRTTESILRDLKDYAERVLTPRFLLDLDERGEFPHQVLRDLYDPALLGLHLLFIPKQYGGMGASAHDVCRVSEALAGIDLGIATGLLATFLGTDPLLVGGTEAQKQRWMTRIAREGLLVACAATEAQAGSDLAAMQTRAEPVLEEGKVAAYRLTGRKQSITNGSVAALYTVLALAPGGPSWFLVQRNAEGLSHGKPENKHGIRASNTSALLLDGVVVPSEALLGEVEGRGLEQAQSVFGYTRLMVAAFGLGAGLAALRKAVEYSRVRVQGGSALSEKQAFTHKLTVPNLVRLEAARAYIEWTAGRFDAGGESVGTEGSVAKYLATEAGNRAAEDAIQALGRCGYAREYGVEKLKRDVRITTIYEGTSEMLE
jgi:alkylation response protein AidB-like acyl-CoA dehydrogenase